MKEYDFESSGNSNGSGNGISKARPLESRVDPFIHGFTPNHYTRDGEIHYGRELLELREKLWYLSFREIPVAANRFIYRLERDLRQKKTHLWKIMEHNSLLEKGDAALPYFYGVVKKLKQNEQRFLSAPRPKKLYYRDQGVRIVQDLYLQPELLSRRTRRILNEKIPEKLKTELQQLQSQYDYRKEEFLKVNLRLVLGYARQYLRTSHHHKFWDFVEEGAIGLLKAIDRFDSRKGYRFSTYADHWIKQSLGRTHQLRERTIYVPAHHHDGLRNFRRLKNRFWAQHGIAPSLETLQELSGKSRKVVEHLESIPEEPWSIDNTMDGEGSSTFEEVIADHTSVDPVTETVHRELGERLEEQLQTLKPKEADILRKRFGFNERGKTSTLEEIGQEYCQTRERMRQIEAQALQKLRHPSRREKLEPFR